MPSADENQLYPDEYYNTFAMDELSRMLNMSRTRDAVPSHGATGRQAEPMAPRDFYSRTSNNSRQPKRSNVTGRDQSFAPNNRGSERNNSSSTSVPAPRRPVPRTTVNSLQRTNAKRTNESRNRPGQSHMGLNSRSNTTGARQNGNSEDLDRLLAMHLAEDLNGSADIHGNGFPREEPIDIPQISAADFVIDHDNDDGRIE